MRRDYPFEPSRRETDEAFRREVWLQIYLPLILGALLIGALVAVAFLSPGFTSTSNLADVSLILVLSQAMLIGVVPLALIAALAFGVWYAIRELPPYLQRAADFMARVADETYTAARYVRSPSLAVRRLVPALSRLARSMVTGFMSRS